MNEDLREFHCPACQATISAFPDQLGQIVQCGYCHERFELTTAPTLPPVAQPAAPPMAIRRFNFQCQRCGSVLEGQSDLSGRQGQCPTCAAHFTIPEIHPATGLPLRHGETDPDGANPTPMHAYAAAGDKAPQIIKGDDGRNQIQCPRCTARSTIDADNCARCGLPFTVEGASFGSASSASKLANASWILGVLAVLTSWCLIGGLFGLFAIGFGFQARWHADLAQSEQRRNNRKAAVGIGLGITAVLIAMAMYIGRF